MIADICNHTQNKQGSRINKHIQVNKINKKDFLIQIWECQDREGLQNRRRVEARVQFGVVVKASTFYIFLG